MSKSVDTVAGTGLFGIRNESSLWGWDLRSESGEKEVSLDLASSLVGFVVPVSNRVLIRLSVHEVFPVEPGKVAVLSTGGGPAEVTSGSPANAIILGIERELLASMMDGFRPAMSEEMRSLVFSTERYPPVICPSHGGLTRRVVPAFREPEVSGPARSFWFESQLKELISMVCFQPVAGTEEFFCSRQKRLSLDRVATARAFLEAHLEESLDLQRLADHVGCSPFYLSRTFSGVMGMTISQFFRKARIDKAAELLISGNCNVSEAAVEVGYQSLSHFSKAFVQVKGCLPSKYEAG